MRLQTSLPFDKRTLGQKGEEEAVRYLAGQGYQVLARGFRLLRGEIDIIARHGEVLVFVEVKTRRSTEFGFPDESVTRAKQNQIRRIAQGYLMKQEIPEERTACRFDVLSLVWTEGRGFAVTHLVNAF